MYEMRSLTATALGVRLGRVTGCFGGRGGGLDPAFRLWMGQGSWSWSGALGLVGLSCGTLKWLCALQSSRA